MALLPPNTPRMKGALDVLYVPRFSQWLSGYTCLEASLQCIACCMTGLAMPSSLPHPPKLKTPDPPFEYDTYVVRNVKISDDLKWSNPHTKNEGARPPLQCHLLPACACLLSMVSSLAVCLPVITLNQGHLYHHATFTSRHAPQVDRILSCIVKCKG